MFWNRFYELCNEIGKKPSPVAVELGLSAAVLTKWKTGVSYPNGEILIKMAQYFDCSIDYIVGISDVRSFHEHKTSILDSETLAHFQSLSKDSQDEIIHIINYKYEQLIKKRKETLSTSGSSSDLDTSSFLA